MDLVIKGFGRCRPTLSYSSLMYSSILYGAGPSSLDAGDIPALLPSLKSYCTPLFTLQLLTIVAIFSNI